MNLSSASARTAVVLALVETDARGAVVAEVSATAQGRRRRRLLRHQDRRPVSLDGGPERRRGEAVGRCRERAHVSSISTALPVRDALQEAHHRSVQLSARQRPALRRVVAGSTTRNTGLQRQNVIFTRETLTGPETVAHRSRISCRRTDRFSCPDSRAVAGRCDTSPTARRKAARTGRRITCANSRAAKQLPDVIRWVKFSSIAWTDGRQGLLLRPLPGAAVPGKTPRGCRARTRRSTTTGWERRSRRIGWSTSVPSEPMLFIDADVDETGRYVWFVDEQGHEQQERAVREGSRRSARAEG